MTPLQYFGFSTPSVSSAAAARDTPAASFAAAAVIPISATGASSGLKLLVVSAAKREPLTVDESVVGDQIVTRHGSAVIYGGFCGLEPRPLKRVRGDSQGGWVPLHTTPEIRFWSNWVVRQANGAGAD